MAQDTQDNPDPDARRPLAGFAKGTFGDDFGDDVEFVATPRQRAGMRRLPKVTPLAMSFLLDCDGKLYAVKFDYNHSVTVTHIQSRCERSWKMTAKSGTVQRPGMKMARVAIAWFLEDEPKK